MNSTLGSVVPLAMFPSNTLIYGISRDGSKNINIRTCEQLIFGQLTMGARQAKNAPLPVIIIFPMECREYAHILVQLEMDFKGNFFLGQPVLAATKSWICALCPLMFHPRR